MKRKRRRRKMKRRRRKPRKHLYHLKSNLKFNLRKRLRLSKIKVTIFIRRKILRMHLNSMDRRLTRILMRSHTTQTKQLFILK